MRSLWDKNLAKRVVRDPLALRVYTSRLLGQVPDLVLHGGGNTSVKTKIKDIFGKKEDVIYIKGSGFDLATIEKSGFAPVKMAVLLRLAQREKLTDADMLKVIRSAMIDPYAPNPSVEAILHAIIPYRFVDHTHADSVVTITNTVHGRERIREIYGDRVLLVPYVMPGFALVRKIYELTQAVDWKKLEGIIVLNHGIFTFHHEAKDSYETMIKLVTKAEKYIRKRARSKNRKPPKPREDLLKLAWIRQLVSKARKHAVIAQIETGPLSCGFSNRGNLSSFATKGLLTPDHVTRTKRVPLLVGRNPDKNIEKFERDYKKYFDRYSNGHQKKLDPAPRWAVWPGHGTVSFGRSSKEVKVISDISAHTIKAIERAELLGGWRALSEKDIFDVEYWTLQQAKIRKDKEGGAFKGKVVCVTGAASGIGLACVNNFREKGAAVTALDINPKIMTLFESDEILKITCDITKEFQVKEAINRTIRRFGGLDILINNAGIFPLNENIAEMNPATWRKSLAINLTGHQLLLKSSIPFLSLGVDPTVIFVASKNVRAPGPGVSAYSVAKAGVTQLARVAALELGPLGIRVNVVHPNQVFDTAIWTEEKLRNRARNYGMGVEEYKMNNLLKVKITSDDVAELVSTMASDVFAKTTGTQVTIDGGNERVI